MNDEEQSLAEMHQERMCKLCELHILGCNKNSFHYQCEGSRCEDAIGYLIDELEDEKLEKRKENGIFPIY